MKKLFSNAQTLKSSEDCKKYSKSVSYETLVGGTATTGSAYKQTQLLSECCANYRFCKTMRFLCENLVDGLLQTLPVFRLVKILSLVVFLSAVTISESQAENTEEVTIVHSGNCGINGADNCQWSLDSKGKLTVTGSGATDNYSHNRYYHSPWSDYRNDIFSVDVSGISTIGKGAFGNLPNLKDVYIADSVTGIGVDAFWLSPMENIRISDSLTAIDQAAFQGNHLTSIIVPDTAIIKHTSFGGNPELQIICKGSQETCAGLMKQMQKYSMHTNEGDSIVNLSSNVHLANYTNCTSSKYFWDGTKCVREPDVSKRKCCADVCKDMGGWCNRIRYTPAEAAKVLRDDNKNEVIITFKK